jgi:hypothetical protein
MITVEDWNERIHPVPGTQIGGDRVGEVKDGNQIEAYEEQHTEYVLGIAETYMKAGREIAQG